MYLLIGTLQFTTQVQSLLPQHVHLLLQLKQFRLHVGHHLGPIYINIITSLRTIVLQTLDTTLTVQDLSHLFELPHHHLGDCL